MRCGCPVVLQRQAVWRDGTTQRAMSPLDLRIRGHAQELPVSRAYVHLFKAM